MKESERERKITHIYIDSLFHKELHIVSQLYQSRFRYNKSLQNTKDSKKTTL